MTDLKALPGKFRVVGVDTFAHEDYLVGDFDTKDEAILTAKKRGDVMEKMHVYDDTGKHLFDAGSF